MELPKNFDFTAAETKWTRHWKQKGYFNSNPDERKPFTVVIPPPNVTGVLHMGHTLNETVQDILVRHARMSGFNACWVPGSDHASIATEAKVVEMLDKEKGIKKTDISRDRFLEYAFEWKEKYGGIIYNQIDRLGCSVDWKRVNFTMDKHYYDAVIKVFVDLYNKGLIYRGARMINWDPNAKTALSDEEVEYRDVQGKLYYVKYLVEESVKSETSKVKRGTSEKVEESFVVIATQRPETIMGDTGVAVNPNDERYAHLKGKRLIVPMVNRSVPVVFDDYVDMEFGTGALKITPAHDINDYNLGLKHHLEIVDTLNEDGTLSPAAQVFVGMDRFEARKKAIERLREEGLLVKEEDYTTRLGFSQRTHAVVEPRISTQWFVKMKEFAGPALKEVTEGRIRIHPGDKFLATYKYWLENVKDWCISRQLWWGQRIPAWYDHDGKFFVAENQLQAARFKLLEQGIMHPSDDQLETYSSDLHQDEDVLDTWFSSWLWPIEVFNGITDPGNKDFQYYYPTSVLVTGQDIIFFWVARMIMAGMEYMKERPFEHVYFTGMVRDKQGRKMSKQLGNSPDLLDLIDRYGADAVRFGIMISSPAGNDLLFDENSLEQGRNFNNKIWNAMRLVKLWAERREGGFVKGEKSNVKGETGRRETGEGEFEFAVEWFENRLNEVRIEVDRLYADFKLSDALKTIYSLIWDDFCSWYLEWVKPGFEQPISNAVYEKTIYFFEELLMLLHPFMPFISEDIYHLLKERKEGDDITIRQFRETIKPQASVLAKGSLLKEVISSLRDARTRNQLKPRDAISLTVDTKDASNYRSIEPILAKQVNAEKISFGTEHSAGSITVVVQKDKFYIETGKTIDTGSQKEQLLKDLEYLKGFLSSVDKKLSNERFVQNAKPEVVEVERKKKSDAEAKIKVIEESLMRLKN